MRVFVRYLPLVASLVVGVPSAALAQGRSATEMARLRDSVAQVGGRVIVLLKSSDSRPHLVAPGTPPVPAAEMQDIQTRLATTPGINVTGQSAMIGAVFAVTDSARLEVLNSDPNVLSMEADRLVFLQATRDGASVSRTRAQDLPWGISQITAPDAWALGYKGDGVKVGIMDSGGDPTHPDLVWAGGYSAVDGGTAPSDWQDDVTVCDGHGTHVAGTVAAQDNGIGVVGVAPNVSLYAIKVFFDFSGQCAAYTSTQITALQWAVSQHIRVVNASIGGGFSSAYQTAVDQAAAQGTFLVAAAGNDNGGAVEYPGAYPSAIAVSSLSTSNTRSSFSSAGPQVWVGAPGENVESTLPGGGYGYKSGTSMATPHVTGTVALLVEKNPNITLAGVRQALENGALDIDAPGFDNNTGWGLDRAAFALGGGTAPLTIAVAPRARSATVQQGSAAPSDNATVTLSGTNAASTAWTATNKKSWNTFTTGSGTGSGTVAWSRNATGLAVGNYVDTITVSATGASGSPSVVYDTLHVTAAVIPVTLALTPAARSVSVQLGTAAPTDNGTVTLTGTNASTTAWTATKKGSWNTLTTASGTGSGTVAWSRNATGLAVGTYVDTITVTAPGAANGSPARIFDTLRITAAVVPVTLAVAPAARSVSVQQGSTGPSDNASITFTGTNAPLTSWTATKRQAWTTLTTVSGTGNGTVNWNRNTSGLAVGTYVDTITVSAPGAANGSPAMVFDTVRVTAPIVPVTLAVSPAARSTSVQQGGNAPGDNGTVTLTGTNASTTAWSATTKRSWNTLTVASGTGSGTVAWTRNATGLSAGTYVDTITVTAPGAANGSPAMIFDTLHVTAPVVALAVYPGSQSATAQQGGAAPSDTVNVQLLASIAWIATNRHSWNTLTVASNIGSGRVIWSRSTAGLAPGIYVDTITVTASGAVGSPSSVIDSFTVTPAPATVIAVAPSSRNVAVQQGTAAPSDNATVTITGGNAGTTTWTATRRQAWTTLTTASGTGSGTVAWSRNTAGLAVGTYVDTITVAAAGAVGSPATVFDTVRISAAPVAIALAVTPGARSATVQQGGVAPSDNAAVALTGTNAGSITWTAANKHAWITLTTANGTGTGTVAWTRSAAGLTVGTYVDTITVTAPGAATGSPATVFDTLHVTSAPVAVLLAVSPVSRSVSVAQGSAAPGDSAAVSLSGTNAGTTGWSASTRKPWTTLTVASGTGSGTVRWQRNATGLAAGVYVDTITVTAPGAAAGSPAMVFDTLRITATPIVVSVAPVGHHKSVKQGTASASDAASVTLSGTGAGTTNWNATNRRSWNTFGTSSGTGDGTVSWVSNTAALGVGVYVDTITVAAGTNAARVIDTVEVTGKTKSIALNPKGKSARALMVSGSASLLSVETDSALVEGDDSSASWIASTSSSRLVLTRVQGPVNTSVVWQRSAVTLPVGMHVDTIEVQLASDASVQAVFVDTLNVVEVALPDPQSAVEDLFQSNVISEDQRTVLDRLGNNNGRYDLGDFLAWVDRSHLQLTADVMAKLQSLGPAHAASGTPEQAKAPPQR